MAELRRGKAKSISRNALLFQLAVSSLGPAAARADMGLPPLPDLDTSNVPWANTLGAGIALSVSLTLMGIWAVRNPRAALAVLLGLTAAPFLVLAGLFLAVVFGAFVPLPYSYAMGGVLALAAVGGSAVWAARLHWKKHSLGAALRGQHAWTLLAALVLLVAACVVVGKDVRLLPVRRGPPRPPSRTRAEALPWSSATVCSFSSIIREPAAQVSLGDLSRGEERRKFRDGS